jgi:hypothetical protein
MIRIFKKGETGKKFDLSSRLSLKGWKILNIPRPCLSPPGGGCFLFLLGALMRLYKILVYLGATRLRTIDL